ncbi:methyltransferase domain-containing protein [Amycolatopsis sp. NPDC059657]|uniref:methyltransferase domain-containing protein n=1 Tax=Amycolatopsis sp. NPDC059657 TaxID=3346899 RepID=UPI003671FA76
MSDAARLRRKLVRRLREDGALTDPRWAAAFRTVPRHLFLPRFFVTQGENWDAMDEGDPGWLARCYADEVLVTQLDDDSSLWHKARETGPVPGVPTCSSSMPGIMAIMLEALETSYGDRVLEVGTGTGYNAALLCHALGSAAVSTIDIDAGLVDEASAHLTSAGYQPVCAVTDGRQGFPARAPFDRVLCTCAVSSIPPAWLEQTVPGGLIVTTLHRPLGAGLVRIVAGAGATGEGRVLARDGRFMPLRAHRGARPSLLLDAIDGPGSFSATSLQLNAVTRPSSPFEFFAGLALPGVLPYADYLLHPDGSWARHHGDSVEQGGPRRLWDEVLAAHAEWTDLGEPRRSRFGLTVTPTTQDFWLDSPESPHRWPIHP